jgi:hypothetical protein
MQTLFEAANQISQEIERTRAHLANLENALAALKPLMGIDLASPALGYAVAQPVQDVSFVHARVINAETVNPKRAEKPDKVKVKAKASENLPRASKIANPKRLPATDTAFWLACFGRKNLGLVDLVDTALNKLELDASAREVIKTRASAWLYGAIRKGGIKAVATRDGKKLYQRVRG